jgi:hypothetical protein
MNGTLNASQAVFNVYLYWGDNDGGSTPGSWDTNTFIGSYTNVNGVSLDKTVSGLAMGTTYHYRFLASNLATNMWASPSTNFTTIGPEFTLPFEEPFDARTLGSLNGQYGWVATGAEVQNSITHLGSSKAACLTNETGEISHTFVDGQDDVWTDWYVKPSFGDEGGAPTPSTNTTVAFFVNTNGFVKAFDGAVITQLVHAALTEGGDWIRFTVHSDYTSEKWDLFMDGLALETDLDFYTNTVSSYTKFGIDNAGASTNAYVDNIGIQLSSPLSNAGTIFIIR